MSADQQAAMVAIQGVPSLLSYEVGGASCLPNIGDQVLVEVGRGKRTGWIVDLCSIEKALSSLDQIGRDKKATAQQLSLVTTESRKLKPILKTTPGFSKELMPLLIWISDYYGFPLADVIENAVPAMQYAKPRLYAQLLTLNEEEIATHLAKLETKAPVQAKIISYLNENGKLLVTEIEQLERSARAALRALEKKEIVQISEEKVAFNKLKEFAALSSSEQSPQLTSEQELVLKDLRLCILAKSFSATLLFGVTGSGKTEVYIQAIKQVLAQGQSALIIVPEIALTPQLLDRLQVRFDEPIAVLHSQVLASERWGSWESALNGDTRIAIGARSAVFAPLQNLGLIIVDEEHEGSYKQSEGIRYNGRDVAVMRAKFANCPIILGSATPSFESLLNVKRGRYRLAEMNNRVSSRALPSIEVVDLRTIKRKEMVTENISPALHQALCETIAKGEQVIILYNRRGFSSYLQCSSCGDVVLCPSCSVTMTFHRSNNILVCHHCGYSKKPPLHCHCRDSKISRIERDINGATVFDEDKIEKIGLLEHRGSGTEKVVDELASLFPTASIARLDRDSVTQRDDYRNILERVRSGETQILVGTQMIAKGHDLPNVTLVGIIDADIGLHLPDFRASERAFQLITQAAGRAGRGELAGKVILQTREPEHPTILAAVQNRFKAFARFELDFRKELNYPPWGRMMRVIVSSTDRHDAIAMAGRVNKALQHIVENIISCESISAPQILGPAPAAIERLKDRYRYHLLIKSDSAKLLSELAQSLNQWKLSLKQEQSRIVIDIDPLEML